MKATNSALAELRRTANENVFVMMRYRSNEHFQTIEEAIRNSLASFGLFARFAKDGSIVDDLWDNIVHYMDHSRYGLVVFEEIDEREFNPNVSLELGYMYAQGKRCLLLKERRMPRLPTDICGRIYKDFDMLNLGKSIQERVSQWCEKDLRLSRVEAKSESSHLALVFDNSTEDPEFRTWGVFCSDGGFTEHISLHQVQPEIPDLGGADSFLKLQANGTESVGVNKDFGVLHGRARFQYRAAESSAENPNLLFCMIPMKGSPRDLLEVGARGRDEAENAFSPYRSRYFVPEDHIADQEWHWAELDFDFRTTPTAEYSIFAPRINEGCPRPGSGELDVRSIEILEAH